jgi:hypothetical protein
VSNDDVQNHHFSSARTVDNEEKGGESCDCIFKRWDFGDVLYFVILVGRRPVQKTNWGQLSKKKNTGKY